MYKLICIFFCIFQIPLRNFTSDWANGVAFCALIHNFFPQAFDFAKIDPNNGRQNYEIAFKTGE